MFSELTNKLEKAFKTLRGEAVITGKNVDTSLREVRRALLEADVNFKVVKGFIESVKAKALGKEVLLSVTPGQQIVKIIYEEMVNLMGQTNSQISLSGLPPAVIMVVGLQGSGKTTFCAKLALHLQKKGRKPLLVAADVYRPAARQQLQKLGQQISVPVFTSDENDAVKICFDAITAARQKLADTAIFDTAGRLHVDDDMMQELEQIKSKTHPNEILFVADGMTGQDAVNTAKAFSDRLDFDGVTLTKLDGDTRGGAALSIRAVTQKPIKFIGVGEKLADLEEFHPERMAGRILGMGDVVSLVEKAQETIDMEQAVRLEEKIRKNEFDLQDFSDQLIQIKKMGSMQQLMAMIPGVGHKLRDLNMADGELVKMGAMISSMTKQERSKPQVIDGRRRLRIARGSGTSVQEVNRLLTQFNQMRKMMKKIGTMKKRDLLSMIPKGLKV